MSPSLKPLAFLALLAACGGYGAASASDAGSPVATAATPLPVLDSSHLLADLARLAHDSMAGRGAMTPQNAQARRWLASEFARLGLQRVGGAYEHPWVRPPRREGSDSVRGANVLGSVRGTAQPERVIVVSAHFDHVGTRNGEVFNGADDNASGTAAVLALAAHFARHAPRHTILFALWDAEEVGLQGARAFIAAPPIPLERIELNVNLDMVSRNDRGELFAAGAFHTPRLRPLLDAFAVRAAVTLRQGHDSGGGQNDWTSQSDHGAFHAAGIPFVYFGVEDHPDYHKPTDDVERIQPAFYYRAVRSIGGFIEVVDRQAPRP